jgi:hypothetical protein
LKIDAFSASVESRLSPRDKRRRVDLASATSNSSTDRDFAGATLQKRQNRKPCPPAADRDELLGGFQVQPHGREVKLESPALLKNVQAEIADIGSNTPIHQHALGT